MSVLSGKPQSLVAHEFGHAVGLDEDNGYFVYGDPKVLMINSDTTREQLGISTPQWVDFWKNGIHFEGDTQGINYLY